MLLAVAALGCKSSSGGPPFVPASVPREQVGLPLVEEGGEFSREWRKPDLDFGAYDKILVVPLELVYSDRYVRNHRFDANRYGRAWPPKERLARRRAADLAQLRELFRRALDSELRRHGAYTLVDQPGPGVLSLSVGVLDLDLTRSYLEQDTRGLTAFDRHPTITIVSSLRDSASAEHLDVMLQPSWNYGTTYKSGAGGALWGNIRVAFDRWASDLHALLGQTAKAGATPRTGT